MRRTLLLAALAALSLFALGGVAQAQEPEEKEVPPAFAPPAPAPVIDVASAEAFASGFVARNAWRFLREHPRRVRVLDVAVRCLQHPIIATRFGCVFTLRALTINRRHGWWGHSAKYNKRGHGRKDRRPRFRIRQFGCLGALRITGGPAATPTADVPFVECARVPRGDFTAPEPEPVS